MIGVVPETLDVEVATPPAKLKTTGWRHLPVLMFAPLFAPTRVGPRIAVTDWAQTSAVLVTVLLFWAVSLSMISIVQLDSGQLRGWLENRLPAHHARGRASDSGDRWLQNTTLADVPLTLAERIRLPFAAFVNDLFAATDDWEFMDGAILFGGLALVILLAPNVVMPAVARHLPPLKRYVRCFKFCLWAAVCIIPPTLAYALAVALVDENSAFESALADSSTPSLLAVLTWAWFTRLVIALGEKPATQAEADAGRTRAPLCNRCGYLLMGLHITSNCPECGLPISASLDTGRSLPAWTIARGLKKPGAWLRTAYEVISRRDFFQRLAVNSGASHALHFAAWSCAWCGLLCLPVALIVPVRDASNNGFASVLPSALLITVGIAHLLMWSMLGLVSMVSRTCRRSPTAVLIAGCYASALAIPVVAVTLIAVFIPKIGLVDIVSSVTDNSFWVIELTRGTIMRELDTRVLAWAILMVLTALLALWRTIRGMREVRFAGA